MAARKQVRIAAYTVEAKKGFAYLTSAQYTVVNLQRLAYAVVVGTKIMGYFNLPSYAPRELGAYASEAEARAALKKLYDLAVA